MKEVKGRKERKTSITVSSTTLSNLRIVKAYTGIDIKDLIDKFAKDELDKRGLAYADSPLDI